MAKYTAKDWDEVREAFKSSIMLNTSISSLAQNLDGPDWPIHGKDETPAKYLELGYDELLGMLALKGQSPEKADLLISILKDTLAFDNPFGDMVVQTEVAEKKDNQLVKNLSRLEIPENYPIVLTALGADTMEFCKLEKLTTLGEFAIFAQNMSQSVIVGGDFRKLLNALSHVDEKTLAEFLPFRPGTKGLHLLEAVAQAVTSNTVSERIGSLVDWFRSELEALKADLAAGGALSRHLHVLGSPSLEAKVADVLRPYLGYGTAAAPKKPGLFSRLAGMLKR